MLRAGRPLPVGLFLLAACSAPQPAVDAAAAEAARRALESMPEAVEAFRAARYDEAAERFGAIAESLPESTHAATAAALLGMRDARAYRRILASVENNLGLSHLRARRFAVAERAFLRAARADPHSATAYLNLGLARLHLRRYGEAVAGFEDARRSGAASSELYLQLGRAARGAGDPERARRALERAIALARQAPTLEALAEAVEAEMELALLELDAGRLEPAAAGLRAVLAESPGLVAARYHLARVLARLGQTEAADRERRRFEEDSELMASIQRALAARPGHPETLHYVAFGYERLGLLHLAEVHYRQLLARDPGDAEVVRSLRRLQSLAS